MWTIDMNRCPACEHKDICADRKTFLRALSPLTTSINLDDEAPHADGIVIIACKGMSA